MTPDEILRPGGEPIGTSSHGGDESIRNVDGGAAAAVRIYALLSRRGRPYYGSYPGSGTELPGGGFVGIRGADTDHPTIDVNVPGIPEVSKLHF